MNRNIELIRYRRFGQSLLLLELVNAATAEEGAGSEATAGSPGTYKTISETLADLRGPVRDLYEELRAYLMALGDDVQEKTLKYYVAFKRIKNFACVEVHPGKGCVTVFLKVDPEATTVEPGFTRDVRDIGHFGTGDFEVTLRNRDDLERAKPFFQESYEAS
jgi:predicted transport protein